MLQPIEKIRSKLPGKPRRIERAAQIEDLIVRQRKRTSALCGIAGILEIPVRRIPRQNGGPGLVEPLLERSTLINPAVVIVARSKHRADARQMRWMSDGREHLRRTD